MSQASAGAVQCGIFIKTLSPHIVEVLENSGLDFAVIDVEHAPFGDRDLDLMMLAGRATGLPLYVRVRNPSGIQSALDLGARGIVVPHVDTPDIARAVVSAARFVGGMRGYSGSTRHADYGRATMADAIVRGDQSKVIVQIEHPVAIDNVEAILAVPGIDGILIGRADLALAMGYMSQGGAVDAAVDAMLARITPADKIIGLVVSSAAERQNYTERGANWFLVGTDHGLLCRGVRAALS